MFEDNKERNVRIQYPHRWFELTGTLVPAWQPAERENQEGFVVGVCESGENGRLYIFAPICAITDRDTGEMVYNPRNELALEKMAPVYREMLERHIEFPPDWIDDDRELIIN